MTGCCVLEATCPDRCICLRCRQEVDRPTAQRCSGCGAHLCAACFATFRGERRNDHHGNVPGQVRAIQRNVRLARSGAWQGGQQRPGRSRSAREGGPPPDRCGLGDNRSALARPTSSSSLGSSNPSSPARSLTLLPEAPLRLETGMARAEDGSERTARAGRDGAVADRSRHSWGEPLHPLSSASRTGHSA
jgi:hypothetical protein